MVTVGTPSSVPGKTVAEATLATPTTHGLEVTVAEAADAFADTCVQMLLLTRGANSTALVASGSRASPRPAAFGHRAAALGRRTIGLDQYVDEALKVLTRGQTRRLTVTDVDRRLPGLLCLKRALQGFCNASDVLARPGELR